MPDTSRLERLATLGFAAASGLVAAHEALWVIADDGLQLQQLNRLGVTLAQHALFPGEAPLPLEPKPRKKAKPDLEALCLLPDGRLLAMGSGSRRNRQRCSLFDPASGRARVIDAAALYQSLEAELPQLNIEGACLHGKQLVLAHRGNSEGASDALLRLDAATLLAQLDTGALSADCRRQIIPVSLGAIGDAGLTLTDLACDAGGRLWYSAAAELTADRYDDGPCAGSVIGRFDAAFQPARQWRLPGHHKIEGLSCIGEGQWLLVADADDPHLPSPLLALQLPADD